jgi:hypothetical protein
MNASRKNGRLDIEGKFWGRGRESNRERVLITRKLLIPEDAQQAKNATTAAHGPIFGSILGDECIS